jgi:hypothetical protein
MAKVGKHLLRLMTLIIFWVGAKGNLYGDWEPYCHLQDMHEDERGSWLLIEIRRQSRPSNQYLYDDDPVQLQEHDPRHSTANGGPFQIYVICHPHSCKRPSDEYPLSMHINQIETIFLAHEPQSVRVAWWLDSATSTAQTTGMQRCIDSKEAPLKVVEVPKCCMRPPRSPERAKTAKRKRGNSQETGSLSAFQDTSKEDSCWTLIFMQTDSSIPVRYDQLRVLMEDNYGDDGRNHGDGESDHHTLSKLDDLEQFRSPRDGSFLFAMSWASLGDEDELQSVNVWRQKSNPTLSATVEAYEEIDVRWSSLGFAGK